MEKIIIALGGNALGNTPNEQKQAVKKTAQSIVNLVVNGHRVLICHGNGPQVGMINLAFSEANQKTNGKIPNLDLPEATAMSQGYIGFHLQNAIMNELARRNLHHINAISVVSHVEVHRSDPAFRNPTKPIGNFYTEAEAKRLAAVKNWVVKEDAGRGWRRFVPSPKPIDIVEKSVINELLNQNNIVIACGGGGIPVFRDDFELKPIAGVIDKDNASAKLASLIIADKFIILTAVEYVSINYNQPNEQNLYRVSLKELQKHIDDNQFSPGSMLPKIQAAMDFVSKNPTKQAIIAHLNDSLEAILGRKGTIIYSDKTSSNTY